MKRRAFTLMELMLALSLVVVATALIGSLMQMYARNFATRGEDIRRIQLARSILNMIAEDLRSVVTAQEYDASVLQQQMGGGGGGGAAGGAAAAGSGVQPQVVQVLEDLLEPLRDEALRRAGPVALPPVALDLQAAVRRAVGLLRPVKENSQQPRLTVVPLASMVRNMS